MLLLLPPSYIIYQVYKVHGDRIRQSMQHIRELNRLNEAVISSLGMAIAGLGMYLVIKRYIDANPQKPVTDAARKAGRAWDREIAEQERKKEAGEDQ